MSVIEDDFSNEVEVYQYLFMVTSDVYFLFEMDMFFCSSKASVYSCRRLEIYGRLNMTASKRKRLNLSIFKFRHTSALQNKFRLK